MPLLLTHSHCSAWVMGIDQLAHSVALDPNSLGPNLQRNPKLGWVINLNWWINRFRVNHCYGCFRQINWFRLN
nr:hypothetical protein Q903MT_gene2209 [Picea sitchensis]